MRIGWWAIAVTIVGTATGIGLTYYEFSTVVDEFVVSYQESDSVPSAVASSGVAAVPRAVVDDPFDIGTLEQNATGTHAFRIRNSGDAPLEIEFRRISCGQCVSTDFTEAVIQPGNSEGVEIRYAIRKPGPKFYEFAEFATNDPDQPMIRLAVSGYVDKGLSFSVGDRISLGSVSANEDRTIDFRLFVYRGDRLEITGLEFTREITADLFHVDVTPLDKEQVRNQESRATAGASIVLRVDKGLPLGPIKQTLRVTAQNDDRNLTAELPIEGKVTSDISLLGGRNLDRERSVLKLGKIKRGEGASAKLRIHVRGPHRHDVQLQIGKIDPDDLLTATLGEVTPVADGAAYLHALTIGVAKDARVVNRLGSKQGQVGMVMIETTHPSARQVPVYVSFAIE